MITPQNYFSTVQNLQMESLPEPFRRSHEQVEKITGHGANWDAYNNDATVKRIFDLYFQKLNEHLEQKKEKPKNNVIKAERREEITDAKKSKKASVKNEMRERKATHTSHHIEKGKGTPIEKLDEDVKFIKRYVGLNGKKKTDKQIMSFIDALQRAILERRIRKTSPYSEEIKQIQESLVDAYNKMIATKSYEVTFKVEQDTIDHFNTISDSEAPMLSITFIKRYVGMDGRKATKEKAQRLHDQIVSAIEKGKIPETDKYFNKLQVVRRGLFSYLNTSRPGALKIEKAELNGLLAACGDCSCHVGSLGGVMSSEEIANCHFDTIKLQGKWKELIGEPCKGFRFLIYGNPKGGKSTLAIEFAKYLAENHGKVLYEAVEEGFGATLQEKINRLRAKHPNLLFTDVLKSDLSSYDFVFVDSITKAGMNTEDIHNLHLRYPHTGFIFIVQSTKDGSYRGARDLEHEADTIIHVENGIAKSYGRFNQGGEMRVF